MLGSVRKGRTVDEGLPAKAYRWSWGFVRGLRAGSKLTGDLWPRSCPRIPRSEPIASLRIPFENLDRKAADPMSRETTSKPDINFIRSLSLFVFSVSPVRFSLNFVRRNYRLAAIRFNCKPQDRLGLRST